MINEERFWSKIDRANDDQCWEWTAGKASGYGIMRETYPSRKQRYAHRIAYELLIGPIPPGLYIDHLCRNRGCCNPAHMETVTNGENVRRGYSPFAVNARKTHCPRGHPYDEANTYLTRRGARSCRACDRARPQRKKAA